VQSCGAARRGDAELGELSRRPAEGDAELEELSRARRQFQRLVRMPKGGRDEATQNSKSSVAAPPQATQSSGSSGVRILQPSRDAPLRAPVNGASGAHGPEGEQSAIDFEGPPQT
jgi:hypothetical protein